MKLYGDRPGSTMELKYRSLGWVFGHPDPVSFVPDWLSGEQSFITTAFVGELDGGIIEASVGVSPP